VPPRTSEDDFVAMGAGGYVGDLSQAGAVDGEKSVDILQISEERPDAPEVAEPLFSDVAAEDDVADSLDSGGVEGADNRQKGREAPGVIADARRVELAVLLFHGHIRAGRKDRIEMCGDQQFRTVPRPRPQAEDIALLVHLHIPESEGREPFLEVHGPDPLLERRSGDLADLSLLLNRIGLIGLEKIQSLLNGRKGFEPGVGLRYRGGDRIGSRLRLHVHGNPPHAVVGVDIRTRMEPRRAPENAPIIIAVPEKSTR